MTPIPDTARELSPAELYPIHRARFRGGRTFHRVKKPADWYDLLEAACGKTGYLATGFSMGGVSACQGCRKVVSGPGTGVTA